MRTDHQKRVDEFMCLANQERPSHPIMPSVEVRQLRANLILEEALETIAGLGFTVQKSEVTGQLKPFALYEPNIVEVVDGCADISVVTIGTLSAFGVSDKPILEAVDAANLKKFGLGSYKREDGKWVKPPDFKPADIMSLLIDQGYGDKYFGRPEHASSNFSPK